MADLLNLGKSIPVSIQRRNGNPLFSLQRELDKFMNDFDGWSHPLHFPIERFENLAISPAIDIIDNKDHFKVEIEMPGMGEKDVKVSISHGLLTIKGEKTTSTKDKGKNYVMREISYGSYERNIALPDSVDTAKAKASFKKGMLWVEIPKKAEAAKLSREIPVEKA